VAWTALGLGLRVAHAVSLGPRVSEWEADGFLSVWEGHPWGAINRLRPPGTELLLGWLGGRFGLGDRLQVRLAMVALSLVGLGCAVLAAVALARRSKLERTSGLRAASWVALVWAVHPTLVAAAVTPVPESLLGTGLCLLLAGLALQGRAKAWGWLLAAVGASLSLLLGGLAVAVALAVGVLVYLIPVPPLGRTLAVGAWLAMAVLAGWFVQRGPDAARPWLPDTGWAHSMATLVDTPVPPPNDVPADADLRERQMLSNLGEGVEASGVGHLAAGLLRRLVFDLLGPGRFEGPVAAAAAPGADDGDAPPIAVTAVGWFDVFLRGGLLLFGLTVVALLAPGASSSWPRVGAVAGAVVLLLALVGGALGPLALAPLDLALLAVAGAGVAGSDPRQRRTRRLAFVVGGGLLCTLLLTAGLRNQPLTLWLRDLGHAQAEGRLLVDLTEPPGPRQAQDHMRVAWLELQAPTPLLRQPEAAFDNAMAALEEAPEADLALEAYVRASVELGRYEEAAQVAETMPARIGSTGRKALLLLDWVQNEQRRVLGVPRRMP
jgi:hypothetical protein